MRERTPSPFLSICRKASRTASRSATAASLPSRDWTCLPSSAVDWVAFTLSAFARDWSSERGRIDPATSAPSGLARDGEEAGRRCVRAIAHHGSAGRVRASNPLR
eukprot:3681811-Prymnesium_polylepis.1